MPNSIVNIDISRSDVRVETSIPANELRLAYGDQIQDRGNSLTLELRQNLEAYVTTHISLTDASGRPLILRDKVVWIEDGEPFDHIFARLTFLKNDVANHRFILRDDAVTHIVMSHIIAVYMRGDDQAKGLAAEPELVGLLQNPRSDMLIIQTASTPQMPLAEAFEIGLRHIAAGTDHLLFLLTLLIPAPYLASGGRWSVRRSPKALLKQLALIVTAFTLGHSTTLMLGAMLNWQLPWALVEIAIALSVFVAAVQAWRPIFGNREPAMAGCFGLIHGMAFSAVIGRSLIDPWIKAQAVLAFNLGVETVQLVLVAIAAPLLFRLSRLSRYHSFQALAAVSVGLIAAIWVWQRLLQVSGSPNFELIALGAGSLAAVAVAVAISLARQRAVLEGQSPALT
jgi:hypothetical protein